MQNTDSYPRSAPGVPSRLRQCALWKDEPGVPRSSTHPREDSRLHIVAPGSPFPFLERAGIEMIMTSIDHVRSLSRCDFPEDSRADLITWTKHINIYP